MLKSLLLHLDGGERDTIHVDVAARLAHEHDAHLEAVFTEPEPDMPVGVLGRGASAVYLQAAGEAADRAAALGEQRFRSAPVVVGLASIGWTCKRGEPADVLAALSGTADLLVIGQGDDSARVESVLDAAACPLLVIPRRDAVERVGGHVLVAWDASAPAARAVRGALPVLARADQVVTLAIGEEETLRERVPALKLYLERHGIRPVPSAVTGADTRVGPAILASAADHGCDLIVMGAYGHARLTELLLGGTTRHVLHHMSTPVLLAR